MMQGCTIGFFLATEVKGSQMLRFIQDVGGIFHDCIFGQIEKPNIPRLEALWQTRYLILTHIERLQVMTYVLQVII